MPTETTTNLAQLQAAEAKLLLTTYERNPILFTRGEGVHLFDEHGNQYLDLLSGIGVCALGYNHPAVTEAINKQAQALIHTSNLFFHPHTAELALRLTEITGLDRAFLCNSGTEAWEAALKLAHAHATLMRAEGKSMGSKILCLEDSFHGRTMGSVSTTHKLAYRQPFNPLIPGVEFIPFNNIGSLRETFSANPQDFCAIAFEVLQGEGGINLVSKEFLAAARELCDQTGALLILDEIQSGMGRTGKWTAYQHFGITPDVTTLAKPLANGIPIGAMLCTEAAARAIKPGMHGTTFGGNPLACAVAVAVIDTIRQDNLLQHTAEVGVYFQAQLRELQTKHPQLIKDVRGLGLMIGCELTSADLAKAVLSGMLKRRILINRTHETVLRFLPPFLITNAHVDQAIRSLDDLLSEAARHHLPQPPATGAPAPEETVHG
ncbi:MAG TPA: aspartate aminotransferase family protein [Acidobacteriaceae bacterium]|nr:aspartate aminotransferase family protein [Acidobacteriaceae bacterium]